MKQKIRKVELELFVCPGCDDVIEGFAKRVDGFYFHDLFCWKKWEELSPVEKERINEIP